MKKFLTFALCMAAGSMFAQKEVVDQAAKLSGKFDKLPEARSLIQQAIANPETSQDARTYFTAGKIELDAFDKGNAMSMINPSDPSADPLTLADELMNAYNYFLQALPFDSLPNSKGEVKPKYSKEIVGKVSSHIDDFAKAAGTYYNSDKFYPEAYQGFMIFAEMPSMAWMGNKAPKIADLDRGQNYFNAGLSAYKGGEFHKAADAFRKSQQMGYEDPNAYIYEIASWQAIAQKEPSQENEAKEAILKVATVGNEKFGLSQPIFLNNMVNSMVQDEMYPQALETLNKYISENPDNGDLLGLRGFVYDRADKDDESVADYLKACSMDSTGFETLKNAVKKVFRVGQKKWDALEMSDAAGRQAIKAEYFDVSKSIADKAKAMNPDDSDLNYVIDNIDYALETYFPK